MPELLDNSALSTLTLQSYKWTTQVEDIPYRDKSTISLSTIYGWCLDRENKSNLVRIENFRPRCYVELPYSVKGEEYDWGNTYGLVSGSLSRILGDDAPTSCEFMLMEKTYYYRLGMTFPMLRLEFNTIDAMNHCRNLLRNPVLLPMLKQMGYLSLGVWETDVPHPHKMLTDRSMTYASWFEAKGMLMPEDMKISTLPREYLVDYNDIVPVPKERCGTWLTTPKVMAIDIECYSDKHKAMPNQYYKQHVVTMISFVVRPFRSKGLTKRYGVVFGSCEQIPPSELANTEIINIHSEVDFFPTMAEIIKKEDPEVITGYNIWGFDFRYLNARLSFDRLKWPEMGRINPGLNQAATICSQTRWKSDAYGYNILSMLDIPGRISLDALIFVKRNYALTKYDLDTVGNKFLGRGKHPVKPEFMFIAYEELMEAEKEYNLAIQKGEQDDSREAQRHLHRALEMLEKAKAKTMKIMRYCLEDSELVLDLFDKLLIWINIIESVNVTMVSLEKILSGGQQGQCFAQLYYDAFHHQRVIDHVDFEDYELGGGSVQPPNPGLEDGVFCVDFKSLYPSIMIAYNICYTTLIHEDHWAAVPEEYCWIIKFTQEEIEDDPEEDSDDEDRPKKAKKQQIKVNRNYEYRYIKPNPKGYAEFQTEEGLVRIPAMQGIVPRIVQGLVAARRLVQAAMKLYEEGTLEYTMFNIRQLKIKLAGNSFYGFLGVRKGKMALPPGARSITAVGRAHIAQVNKYLVEEHDCAIVYGDTDSSMAKPNGITDKYGNVDYKAAWARAKKARDGINGKPPKLDKQGNIIEEGVPGLFPPPLEVELEKLMRIVIFSKKRYAYVTVSEEGVLNFTDKYGKSAIQKKGIVQARRDNCLFVKELCDTVLEAVLRKRPITEPLKAIIDTVNKAYAGEMDINHFTFVKQLGTNYKSETNSMRVFAEFLRKEGVITSPGDRLDYVVAKVDGCTRVGERMRSPYLLVERGEEIDYTYYMEKQLKTHLNQIFYYGYKKVIDAKFPNPMYKPKQGKAVGLENITKLMLWLKRFDKPLGAILTTVTKGLTTHIKINPRPSNT